mgnify:CR=1 FL=1
MNSISKVAVCSRSFSKNRLLRAKLLSCYSNVTFNDKGNKLSGDSLINFLKGCDKAIVALEEINSDILEELPELKVISKYGVGLDTIDLHSLDKYRVNLGWIGGGNSRSVAELVVSNAIALLHKTILAASEVRAGMWRQTVGRQLNSCTVGIIGCGHIGKDLVKLLQPFECNILAHDILDFPDFYEMHNVKPVSLNMLLRSSDVITLHLPLNKSTYHLLSLERLHLIKHGAILINLARGGLIDEKVLKRMLQSGSISGLSLDVLEEEPDIDLDLVETENVFITPHIGGSTQEAIIAMGMSAIEGLDKHKNSLQFI